MARARRTELTALQVGGGDRTKKIDLAVPGEYPEDYTEEGEVWKAGYDIAARRGNTEKACVVYANNYQGEELSDAEIEDEISRLTKLQQGRG